MTPADLQAARQALGLSQEQLAQQLGVTGSTIARWEQGRVSMPGMLRLALERLQLDADPEPPALDAYTDRAARIRTARHIAEGE